ncbi:MAG: hypothetical protein H7Z14_06645 [Anaerolineae bacterium]|nr:hypothetical protein [Phycisphaerae bacterium]
MNVFARIFISRKVWVAIGAMALTLLAVANLDPEKWTPVVTAIVTLAGVVIAAIGYEDGAEKSNPSNAAKLAVALMLSLAFTSGCANDPTSRWAQSRDTLTLTQNSIMRAHDIEILSDADFVALDPFVKAVRGALEKAQAHLPNGGEAFDFYMKLTDDTLSRLSNLKPVEATNVRGNSRSDTSGKRIEGVHPSPIRAEPSAREVHGRASRANQIGSADFGRRLGRGGRGCEIPARDIVIV